MQQKNNNSSALFLTFIFPFAGLVYSLANWREKWAKNAFWIACIYLGAVFIFWPEGTILGQGADGGRYALDLMEFYSDDSGLWNVLKRYQFERNSMDYYQPIVTYLISRFTDNGHVLFAVFAIVFGFFYSRNIWYVLDRLPNKRFGSIGILVALYFLVCPITQINGVRMWTALHIYVYAMLPYLLDRDKSKLWYLILAPFVHFSFLYVSLFAAAYVLLPFNFKTRNLTFASVALIIFIGSMFVNTLNLDEVNGMLQEYSPEAYESRIDLYVNQDAADRNASYLALSNWYVSASGNIQKWCYNLLLLFMFPCIKRNFSGNTNISNIYVFSLLLGSFANIMALIPSGGRFQLLAMMFKLAIILIVTINIPKTDRFIKYINPALIILLIPLFVEFRKVLDYVGISFFIGDFFTSLFWESNVPIINFIKSVI